MMQQLWDKANLMLNMIFCQGKLLLSMHRFTLYRHITGFSRHFFSGTIQPAKSLLISKKLLGFNYAWARKCFRFKQNKADCLDMIN